MPIAICFFSLYWELKLLDKEVSGQSPPPQLNWVGLELGLRLAQLFLGAWTYKSMLGVIAKWKLSGGNCTRGNVLDSRKEYFSKMTLGLGLKPSSMQFFTDFLIHCQRADNSLILVSGS